MPLATSNNNLDFAPSPWLRSGHVQSVLASAPWRKLPARWRHGALLDSAEDIVLENNGVQLLGHYHSPVDPRNCPGLVVLLHGWEGSAKSAYIVRATAHLHALGYAIFRLNFRDHGDTHHLNRELFHSCRLDEAVDAVADIAKRFPDWPLNILGYSLGGNFSLRIARRAPAANIAVRRVIAVCPLIDPANGMDALDSGPAFYRRYFMRKWRRSLKRKQALYPDQIQVDEWLRLDMRALTTQMVETYTEYPTVDDYFRGYSVAGDYLRDLQVDCHVLSAADDPVIPIADVRELPNNPHLRVTIFARGGHCGFVDRLIAPSWLENRIELELGGPNFQAAASETLPC